MEALVKESGVSMPSDMNGQLDQSSSQESSTLALTSETHDFVHVPEIGIIAVPKSLAPEHRDSLIRHAYASHQAAKGVLASTSVIPDEEAPVLDTPTAPMPNLVPKTPVMPKAQPKVDPFSVPYYQHPEVIKALGDIWTRRQNGESRAESSFNINSRKPDGTPIIVPNKDTEDYSKETFNIGPNTTAIFHTHPNIMDPRPSEADMKIARDHPTLEMYTMTRNGIWLYKKGFKEPQLVVNNLDFLSPKK